MAKQPAMARQSRSGPALREVARQPAAARESGSGTVLTLLLVGSLILLLPLALTVATATQAAQRARAAADLGAIAAASSFARGVDAATACARGAALVTANRAAAVGCTIRADGRTELRARVTVRLPVFGTRATSASAVAGIIFDAHR